MMEMTTEITAGRVAFEKMASLTREFYKLGDPPPREWETLDEKTRADWEATAKEAIDWYL